MKNNKKCIKCNSSNCVEISNSFSNQTNSIKISAFTCALVTRYICCDCGYMEEWILDSKDLKKVEEIYK